MILDFADQEAESVWRGERWRRLPDSIQDIARRKLRMLNTAQTPEDLRIPPANRLEALKGDHTGRHSIRINGQWRSRFNCKDGNCSEVGIVDYD
ncbi:MAG: type II toxin-antitoxin system RelE/ParE family toxin [Thiobacillaceae bacterium]|jgi:proteic killer suppression protein|nr:type II toxin-antitoxin system RelE/ParE family toxin [Thiobacillaceae bacterium]